MSNHPRPFRKRLAALYAGLFMLVLFTAPRACARVTQVFPLAGEIIVAIVLSLTVGCATSVDFYPPHVTSVWGHAEVCEAQGECIKGGEVSGAFSELIQGVAGIVANFFGHGPQPPVIVTMPLARTCPTLDGVVCADRPQ
jgi:hypothetical protein